MRNTPRPPGTQTGFSLIEVLVTMVVVSLGLLGFAGLQAQSMKSNRISSERSYATMLAYDILDSIRVNKANIAGYAMTNGTKASNTTTCTHTDSATNAITKNDREIWLAALCSNLPEGAGGIVINGNSVTINVQWKETVNSTNTVSFSTVTTL